MTLSGLAYTYKVTETVNEIMKVRVGDFKGGVGILIKSYIN